MKNFLLLLIKLILSAGRHVQLLILLFILCNSLIYGQVRIKERVELQNKVLSKPTVINEPIILTVTMTWTGSTHDMSITTGSIKISNYWWCSGELAYNISTGGSVSVSTSVSVGSEYCYTMRFGTTIGHSGYLKGVTITASVNDKVVKTNSYSTYTSGNQAILIQLPSCDDAPQCETGSEIPTFSTSFYDNGTFGSDGCAGDPNQTGIFMTPKGQGFEDFEIEPCYNSVEDRWQFNIAGSVFRPTAILDLCDNNIASKNYKLLNSVTDITTVYNDPVPCKALSDFEGHRSYPITTSKDGYLIKDIVMIHEHEHRKHFESFFNEEFANKLRNDLDNYNKKCSEMDYEQAQTTGAGNARAIYVQYFDDIRNKYIQRTTGENSDKNEQFIHNNDVVQTAVKYYINTLKYIYNCN